MNLWAPTGSGEDANCAEIVQQQSESFSRTNKLLISSSTPEFQGNCIKNSFLLKSNVEETKYIITTWSH